MNVANHEIFTLSTTNFKYLFHAVPFDPLAWVSLLDCESTIFPVSICIVLFSGTMSLAEDKIY